MADAGRAMMLYRGLYDSTHNYEKLDVVNFNGSLYISTTDGNLGTEPTEETKWKLFLQGGVSDNIRATDTYGLVGTKGDSSFVQLLLDSLASRVGKDGNGDVIEDTYVPKNNILNTEEEIDANTSEGNIAGALVVKSLKSNFANSLDALTNNVNNYKYKELWNGRANSGETVAFTADINEVNWRSLLIAFYYQNYNTVAFCTLPREFCDIESNIYMPVTFLSEITTVAVVPHVYSNTLAPSWDDANFKLYRIFAELN